MSDWVFVRRVLIVFAIGALALALWVLSDILLMMFGAVLVAVLLRTLIAPIVTRTGMSVPWAIFLVVVLMVAVVAALILPFGAKLADQTEYLFQQLPIAFHTVAQELDLGSVADDLKGSAIGGLAMKAFAWGTTAFGAAATFVLIVVGGIYFAAAPKDYRSGAIELFPDRWRTMIAATIDASGFALTRWLRAQFIAMAIVGTMTGVGMWLVGVPSPLALGLIAGLTEFVPIIGPIVGAIPAVLLASSQSWDLALWALGVAVVVQQVENNVIMPFVVGRVVELPAAIGLFSTVAMGVLLGPMGLLLGYPLAIVGDVAVRRLYMREALGKPVDIPAERSRRDEKKKSAAGT